MSRNDYLGNIQEMHDRLSGYLRIADHRKTLARVYEDVNIQRHETARCAWWHEGRMVTGQLSAETRALVQQGQVVGARR